MPQPYAWSRVIKASLELALAQKDVWEEVRILDKGEGQGCWAGNAYIAARIGLPVPTVASEKVRLRDLGLLELETRENVHHWFVRLPAECLPRVERPTDVQVIKLARQLDVILAAQRSTPGSSNGIGHRSRDTLPEAAGDIAETVLKQMRAYAHVQRQGGKN